ncbi:hypothetical protein SH528x_000768 [Novipirellula sp. SH528]
MRYPLVLITMTLLASAAKADTAEVTTLENSRPNKRLVHSDR